MIKLWSNFSLHSNTLSQFILSFVKTMSMLRSRKTVLDPSQLLHCLQNVLIKSGKFNFNLFQQQDGSEIISCILEELCVESPHGQDILRTTLKNEVSYNNCYEVLPNKGSTINTSFASDKVLTNITKYIFKIWGINRTRLVLCNFYQSYQPASLDHQITKVGNYLKLMSAIF